MNTSGYMSALSLSTSDSELLSTVVNLCCMDAIATLSVPLKQCPWLTSSLTSAYRQIPQLHVPGSRHDRTTPHL